MSFGSALGLTLRFCAMALAVPFLITLFVHYLAPSEKPPARGIGLLATFLGAIFSGAATWGIWLGWMYLVGEAPTSIHTLQILGCLLMSVLASVSLGSWSKWRGTGPFVAALGFVFGFALVAGTWEMHGNPDDFAGLGVFLYILGATPTALIVATILALVRHAAHSATETNE
ncbi:hypothetical protein [Corynebacterium pacaense]|uniref:hypothetical protein n=1 Tax=Corynebacterium pacaense TaxID=1816684 RepID=UPI0009BBE00F|nr:hypothetical protein [Corynebacterium pacaense]